MAIGSWLTSPPSTPGRHATNEVLMFDETQCDVQIMMDPDMSSIQQRSAWHTMVSLGAFATLFVPDCDPAASRLDHINCTRPPVIVSNCKAPCLHHGLFHTPRAAELRTKFLIVTVIVQRSRAPTSPCHDYTHE